MVHVEMKTSGVVASQLPLKANMEVRQVKLVFIMYMHDIPLPNIRLLEGTAIRTETRLL